MRYRNISISHLKQPTLLTSADGDTGVSAVRAHPAVPLRSSLQPFLLSGSVHLSMHTSPLIHLWMALKDSVPLHRDPKVTSLLRITTAFHCSASCFLIAQRQLPTHGTTSDPSLLPLQHLGLCQGHRWLHKYFLTQSNKVSTEGKYSTKSHHYNFPEQYFKGHFSHPDNNEHI